MGVKKQDSRHAYGIGSLKVVSDTAEHASVAAYGGSAGVCVLGGGVYEGLKKRGT